MAVSVRSVTTPVNTATINKPTGTTAGDCLIAVAWGFTSITTPSGWTRLNATDVVTTNNARVTAFAKIAGGSEPASYTFTNSIATTIACFTGTDQINPVNVFAGAAFQATSASAPGVTTTVANCFIYRLGLSTSYGVSWTEASGTELFDTFGQAGANDGIQVSAGASTTPTLTQTSNTSASAWTIAIAPSTGAFFTATRTVTATPSLVKSSTGVMTRKVTATTILSRAKDASLARSVVVNTIVSRLVPGQLFQKTWTAVVSPIVTAIRSLLPSAPVPGLMTLTDAAVTRSRMSDLAVTTMTLTDSPVE